MDLFNSYCRYADKIGLAVTKVIESNGHIQARVTGPNAFKAFQHESGKHCIQRIPPTEAKGRRQTSIVTVAILPVRDEEEETLREEDVRLIFQRGHGKGGQHQNKTASAVRAKHLPTSIEVFINGRDQHQNKKIAMDTLRERVSKHYKELKDSAYDKNRRDQWDGGGRSNKVRTYNLIKDRVVDHKLNLKFGDAVGFLKRGRFDKIYK